MKSHQPQQEYILHSGLLAELLLTLEAVIPEPGRAEAMRARVLDKIAACREPLPADFLTIHTDEGEWVRIAPLVEMKMLYRSKTNKSKSYLLRLQPGGSLPSHGHPADEECMVLEGEVRLGNVVAHAGDYHLAPKGLAHGIISTTTGTLLFLRSGVKEHTV